MFPHRHAAGAPEILSIKEFTLFERSEFVNSRQSRGVKGSPKDQMAGRLFFGSFFWTSKKMNKFITKHDILQSGSDLLPGLKLNIPGSPVSRILQFNTVLQELIADSITGFQVLFLPVLCTVPDHFFDIFNGYIDCC